MKYLTLILLLFCVNLSARTIRTENNTYYKARFSRIVEGSHIEISHRAGITRVKWINLTEKYRKLFLLRDFETKDQKYITVQVRQLNRKGIWVWDAFKERRMIWIPWNKLKKKIRKQYGYR